MWTTPALAPPHPTENDACGRSKRTLGGVAPTMSTMSTITHPTSARMAKSAHHDMHIATCGTGKATYDTKNPVALEGNSRRGVRRQVRPHAYLDAAGACAASSAVARGGAGGAEARAAAPPVCRKRSRSRSSSRSSRVLYLVQYRALLCLPKGVRDAYMD